MVATTIWTTLSVVNFALESKKLWEEINDPRESRITITSYVETTFHSMALAFQTLGFFGPWLNIVKMVPGVRMLLEIPTRALPLIYSIFQLAIFRKLGEDRTSAGKGLGLHAIFRRAISLAVEDNFIPGGFKYLAIALNLSEVCIRTDLKDKITGVFSKAKESPSSSDPIPVSPYDFEERFFNLQNIIGNESTLPEVLRIDPFFNRRCPITGALCGDTIRDTRTGHDYDLNALMTWHITYRRNTWPLTRQPINLQENARLILGSSLPNSSLHFFFWSYVAYKLRTPLPMDRDFTQAEEKAFYRRLKNLLERTDLNDFKREFDQGIPEFADYFTLKVYGPRSDYKFCALTRKPVRYPVNFRGETEIYEREALENALRHTPDRFPGKALADIEDNVDALEKVEGNISIMTASYHMCKDLILNALNTNSTLWRDDAVAVES